MNPNNPYYLPERPQKPHFTENSSPLTQRSDAQNHRINSSQLQNGNQLPQAILTVSNMLKKNSFNTTHFQYSQSLKSPPIPKKLSSTQKNNASISYKSSPHTSLKQSRGSYSTTINENKQIVPSSLKQAWISQCEAKEVQEKLRIVMKQMKDHQKRLRGLQKKNDENMLIVGNSESKYNKMDKVSQNNAQEKLQMIETKVGAIKRQMREFLRKDDEIKIEANILEEIHKQLKTKLLQSTSIKEDLIMEIQSMKIGLQEKINQNNDFLTSVVSRIQKRVNSQEGQFRRSVLRSPKSPIILKYIEQFKVSQKYIKISNNQYYVDNEGYLLDEDKYYLMDELGKQVKLSEQHINLLKQNCIL